MDEQIIQKPVHSSGHEALVHYQHCSLCGAFLHFKYYTDFSKNLTQETAKCPECGVEARNVIHKLQ